MSAYIIVQLDVHDAEAFERYREQVPATIAQYGGRYLVRGGEHETVEGSWSPKRMVVLEFESREAAKRWHNSPEYAGPKALRLSASHSEAIIIDGV